MKPRQWHLYQTLELIPASIQQVPDNQFPTFSLPLRMAWRSFVNALAHELVFEQQIEYLERCLEQSKFTPNAAAHPLQELWTLMN